MRIEAMFMMFVIHKPVTHANGLFIWRKLFSVGKKHFGKSNDFV